MSGESFQQADPDNNEMQQMSHTVDKATRVKTDNIEQGMSDLPDICPLGVKTDSDLQIDADLMSEDDNTKETQEDNCEEENYQVDIPKENMQQQQPVQLQKKRVDRQQQQAREVQMKGSLPQQQQSSMEINKPIPGKEKKMTMTSRFEKNKSEECTKDKHESCKESHDKTQAPVENANMASLVDAITKVHLDKDLSTSQESSSVSCATHILDEIESRVDEAGKGLQECSPNADRQLVTGASSSSFLGLVESEECHTIPVSPSTPVKLSLKSSPPTEELYDILIIHSECAEDWKEVDAIRLIGKECKWKIISVLEFPSGMSKFEIFSTMLKQCTYVILLLTKNFFGNVWNNQHYTVSLTAAIENKDRQWSVIPVLYPNSGCKVPLELTAIAGLNRNARFFNKNLKSSISTKKRRERESAKGFESDPTPSLPTSIVPEFPVKQGAAERKTEIMENTSHLSAGELYRCLKPELTPTEAITKFFTVSDRYRKICNLLDSENLLGRDYRLLAEMVGFNGFETSILAKEKSPTAKILEVFCLKNTSKPKLEVLNIFLKMVTHLGQQEVITEVENEIIVAKFSR